MISKLLDDLRAYATEFPTWADLLTEAADTIETLLCAEEQKNTNEWIPCNSGKMPHGGETVLIQLPERKGGITLVNGISVDISFARTSKNEWVSSCGTYPSEDVVAWQSLPKPYQI